MTRSGSTRHVGERQGDSRQSVRTPLAASPLRRIGSQMHGRRRFLKAAGVALGLPLLDAFVPRAFADREDESQPRRMVFICTTLGLHGPNFFPEATGNDFELTPYLEPLAELRDSFTVFSGLSHPEQAGQSGHSSQKTWLTSARHPELAGFRNSVSVDQLAAERLGFVTRFPSLILGTSNNSQSYTRSGVMIPAMGQPSKVFAELFLAGADHEIEKQIHKLREGRSILDAVADEANRISKRSGRNDRLRLEEYFSSVRDLEKRLEAAEEWVKTPKPEVDAEQPQDIADQADTVGRTELMFDLIPLALQTDSTRVIAVTLQGRNDVPPIQGVNIDHHNLSHHGHDETKIEQLERIEQPQMDALGSLLTSLAGKDEGGKRLLDNTAVAFGSNLGNANSHDWRNLPILLAGGGFKHGRHQAFDADNNIPLSNLFLSMLQFQGHELDAFGSSSGTVTL